MNTLSRASKRLNDVAQEVIYGSITLDGRTSALIAALGRTLLDRSHLASRTRHLALSLAVQRYVSFGIGYVAAKEGSSELSIAATKEKAVSHLLRTYGITNSSHNPHCRTYRAVTRWRHAIEQQRRAAYAGLLLTIFPNLVDLELLIYRTEEDDEEYHCLHALLATSRAAKDLVHLDTGFKGLRTVKRLKTLLGNLDILNLPFDSLERLELEVGPIRQYDGAPENFLINIRSSLGQRYSGLKDLVLYGYCSLHPWRDIDPIVRAIGSYNIINFEYYLKHNVPAGPTGSLRGFRHLLAAIRPLESRLEHLKLDVHYAESSFNLKWLEGIQGATTFTNFTHLRSLKVLQAVIVYPAYGGYHPKMMPALCFPRSLESFTIICPNPTTVNWLRNLGDAKEVLPRLQEIVLSCRTICGEQAPQLSGWQLASHKLRARGVQWQLCRTERSSETPRRGKWSIFGMMDA